MPDVVSTALVFLINTLFDLYLFVLMIRLILAYVGANYFDTLTQFFIKLTNPIVKPIRRIIPNIGRIELATILIILILEFIKYALIITLALHIPNFFGLLILSFADAFKILLNTFFYTVILQAILTWLQPFSLITRLLTQFTSPVLRPFQRIIPPISGIDISPIFALIILQLLIIVAADPLLIIGMRVALS